MERVNDPRLDLVERNDDVLETNPGKSFRVTDAECATAAAPVATLQLGTYHLWVDDGGKLRISATAPAYSTDGTVVGAQTA